jgi:hypothetical protein
MAAIFCRWRLHATRSTAAAYQATHCPASVAHVTRHTSHVTRHTSHVTRHTSHPTPHPFHAVPERINDFCAVVFQGALAAARDVYSIGDSWRLLESCHHVRFRSSHVQLRSSMAGSLPFKLILCPPPPPTLAATTATASALQGLKARIKATSGVCPPESSNAMHAAFFAPFFHGFVVHGSISLTDG